MAKFERPVNEIDFTTEQPNRQEEEYLYKYMQMKPAKKQPKIVDVDGDDTDPELEAFATQQIEAEMKKMQGGDIDDDLKDESEYGSEENQSEGEDRFFSGDEELEEIELD